MTLKLSVEQIRQMRSHAESTYPNECCGLLLGSSSQGETVLVDLQAVQNRWSEEVARELGDQPTLTQTRRYWIDPLDLLAAMRDARSRKLDIIGIYHSHPDHAAHPSECDRRLAWEEYSYIIISVEQGEAREFYSWKLDAHRQFQLEEMVVTDAIAP